MNTVQQWNGDIQCRNNIDWLIEIVRANASYKLFIFMWRSLFSNKLKTNLFFSYVAFSTPANLSLFQLGWMSIWNRYNRKRLMISWLFVSHLFLSTWHITPTKLYFYLNKKSKCNYFFPIVDLKVRNWNSNKIVKTSNPLCKPFMYAFLLLLHFNSRCLSWSSPSE